MPDLPDAAQMRADGGPQLPLLHFDGPGGVHDDQPELVHQPLEFERGAR